MGPVSARCGGTVMCYIGASHSMERSGRHPARTGPADAAAPRDASIGPALERRRCRRPCPQGRAPLSARRHRAVRRGGRCRRSCTACSWPATGPAVEAGPRRSEGRVQPGGTRASSGRPSRSDEGFFGPHPAVSRLHWSRRQQQGPRKCWTRAAPTLRAVAKRPAAADGVNYWPVARNAHRGRARRGLRRHSHGLVWKGAGPEEVPRGGSSTVL
jgi:hypothetical protein